MLTARCCDRCPAAGADCVAARRPIAVTGSHTTTMAATTTDGSYPTAAAPCTTSTTATSTAAAPFGQRGTYRQGNDSESEHEHSDSCHVGPPP
jgi:hypothetical protein